MNLHAFGRSTKPALFQLSLVGVKCRGVGADRGGRLGPTLTFLRWLGVTGITTQPETKSEMTFGVAVSNPTTSSWPASSGLATENRSPESATDTSLAPMPIRCR